jgi:sugar phosphate isomerase/epimerase
VDLLGRMAEAVRALGCQLALENEAVCWGATGLEAAGIIRQVGADLLSLCWDPGNALRAGAEHPFPDEYEQLKDLVSHVHMKNFNPASGVWSLIEEGSVDWPGQLAALARDRYDGFLVVETHLHVSPDAFRFVEGSLSGLESNTLRNLRFVQACLQEVQQERLSIQARDQGETA